MRVHNMLLLEGAPSWGAKALMVRLRFGGKLSWLSSSMLSAFASFPWHSEKCECLLHIKIPHSCTPASTSCICISGCNMSTMLCCEKKNKKHCSSYIQVPKFISWQIKSNYPPVDFYSEIMHLSHSAFLFLLTMNCQPTYHSFIPQLA